MGLFGASAGGNGGIWGMGPFHNNIHKRSDGTRNRTNGNSKSSSSVDATGGAAGYRFPLKQAATAASLALTGDTIAQVRHCWVRNKDTVAHYRDFKDIMDVVLSEHDWIRALRMTSYGFLLYGPGSYAWYQFLDHSMPKQTVENLLMKVLLNQIALGPTVIAVVFAWNNLWQGKLAELPNKYKKDALPTLLFGFRFWIPVSILNFWYVTLCPYSSLSSLPSPATPFLSSSTITTLTTTTLKGEKRFKYLFTKIVPLQARVAFMSMGSIFWNFFLSSTLSK
ncbi:uncharacterized protein LOC111372072 isoform X2 [Olea europaea var. sylvestris]|uniref:uncharacterized protein LOC111372072 isoform X2 n=1 Tax=Olea europaea var. sylvestris TaxID=158386 RepID=UPI000C1D7912|nr:uncharacterized protein LOC111372072 isoform X2 [Olea europaea var. sylvestris]